VLLIGLLADVISANRKLLEDLVYRVRSLELPRRPDEVATPGDAPHLLSKTGADGRWPH
jgi:hypothetical protein